MGRSSCGTWRPRQIISTLTHGDPITFVSFSPDGGTLAFGGWGEIQIKLWDVATRRIISTLTHGPHGVFVYSASFSPDGTFTSGAVDGTVKLWDVGTGIKFGHFWAYKYSLFSLVFIGRDNPCFRDIRGHGRTVGYIWN